MKVLLALVAAAPARTYVSHAMAKLDARDRAQLVVIAYQTGRDPATASLERVVRDG